MHGGSEVAFRAGRRAKAARHGTSCPHGQNPEEISDEPQFSLATLYKSRRGYGGTDTDAAMELKDAPTT